MNEVFYSSIFGELTKQVQIRIDAASEPVSYTHLTLPTICSV